MRISQIIISGVFIVLSSCGQNEKSAQNESPKKKVTIAEIEAGIRSYIANKTEEESGYFHLTNNNQELRLKLVRVHTEYLSNLGPEYHFACVDLADVKGDVYDVDFFLKGKPGDMRVTETTLHKLNGKPFYTWKQRKDKTWHRVPVEEASTNLLGVIEGQDQFEFRYTVDVPKIHGSARIWIPIASSDNFQTVEVVSIKAPGNREVLKDNHENNILFLELSPAHSNEQIEVVYAVTRKEKGPYQASDSALDKYLESTSLIPVGGRFTSIADEALAGKQQDSKLMQARALYDYIIDNMQYRKAGKYGTGDANYACDSRSGNCTEFHSFFISLARSAGIPARFAIGAAIPSERNEGGVNGYHCWAEFYADGKWWPVDISEANKYTALATYYFGHHPANRIEFSQGRDIEVTPGPVSGTIKFLAYPVFEEEGQTSAVNTIFTFRRKKDNAKKSS